MNKSKLLFPVIILIFTILIPFYIMIGSILVFSDETSIYGNIVCSNNLCDNSYIIVRGWPLIFQSGITGVGGSGSFEALTKFNNYYYIIDLIIFIILPILILIFLLKKYKHLRAN